MFENLLAYAETRMGQTVLLLAGTILVWGGLIWAKLLLEKRLQRHTAFVLRQLTAPLHLGFFIFAVSVAAQILPKEIARHPYLRYGVRLGFIIALFWMLDRLISILLRRSGIAGGGGGRDLVQTLARTLILSVGVLVACDTLGVSITPILASLGVGSVAVALALQGTLGDFFSGIYLILDRPIHPGDFVRLENGIEAQVIRIGWRSTELRVDGRMIVVPNSKISSSVLTNLTFPEGAYTFKVEVGVSYEADLSRVRSVLEEECARVGAMEPKVRFTQFGESGITTVVLARAAHFDAHWLLRSQLIEAVHARFRREGIEIPYPQRVLHQVRGAP